ncbi:MAG: hypothetical protein JWO15_1504 [Sphingomonadales bacterium]|nr:hypothetical protein [Sphingomonadales bacterium]
MIVRERTIDTLAARLNQCLINDDGADIPRPTPITRLGYAIDAMVVQAGLVRHRHSHRNPVTGMNTREALIEAIDRRASDDPHGFLGVIEVSDFDRLCAFDAQSGDQLIKAIASRISKMVRADRAIAQIDRARFAIWFSVTSPTDARKEFDALCYALRNRVTADTIDLLPQFASGFAYEQDDHLSAGDLLARAIADLTMEGSTPGKEAEKKDTVTFARQQFTFEQGLRLARERREFDLVYQPFIRVDQQRVCGAEALLRWRSAEHGLVSPAVFIPVVEAIGLAEEVGLWVLNSACEEAARWPDIGLHHLKVAVNLSALQLGRNDFDIVVQRMLKHHAMPSSALELELTESAAADKSHGIGALFQRLRALGISMSIDDFGAGYSSLSYLKNLKFDKLKIDREFVSGVDHQADSQAICQSIIALGRGLGIEVLAEGVETWDEYAWLRRHGCSFFQGYYFSRPLPPRDFVAFARDTDRVRALLDVGPTALRHQIIEKIA